MNLPVRLGSYLILPASTTAKNINLNPSSIRKNVNNVLSTDNFILPIQTFPKNLPKTVLKEFYLNERDGKFYVPGRLIWTAN